MPRWLLAVIVALLVASCGGDEPSSATRGDSDASPPPGFSRATALIDTGRDSVLLDVEVADAPRERERGLMFRSSLPQNSGMAFIFFEESTGGFWMKNTRIPLSIAFFDEDGKILRILDMDPCRKDPCPVYDPNVSYWGALEVNQGAFDRWDVEVGDTIEIT